jgi:ligand-binding sensor domain-containing protein
MFKFLLSILLFFFTILPNFSQKPSLIFHNLSIQDGLSENSINAVIEDKKGFMWIATQDGLNKYDGYRFTIYNSNPDDSFSVSHRNAKRLFIDSKNRLWICTSSGVNLYDPTIDGFYSYKNNRYPALKYLSKDIVGISEDCKGNIWISMAYEGLYCIYSLQSEPRRYNFSFQDHSNYITELLSFSDTVMLMGTKDGLLKFNPLTRQFTDERNQFGKGYEIKKLLIDPYKNIWLGTTKGLKKITPDQHLVEYTHDPRDPLSIANDGIIDIVTYGNDGLLIGTNASGIEYFDTKTENFHSYIDELSSNNINCVYKDSKQDLWVGTYLNGLNFSNPTTNLFYHVKNNIYSNRVIRKGIVTKFLEDRKGNLLITTDGGGIFCKKKGSETFINFNESNSGLSSNVLINIYEDPDGYFWLTTYGSGLIRYDPKTNSFKNYRADRSDPHGLFNDFTKALCYYNDKLWISGYDFGVGVLDTKTDKFRTYKYMKGDPNSLPSNWVQTFYIDKDNVLWIGTFDGLARYNKKTDNFENYHFKRNNTGEDNADINTLLELMEDSEGHFWIGTMGNGLLLFNKKDASYKIFTVEDGLSDNFIKSIIEDDEKNLWVSTNNGITKLDIKTLKAKPYSIRDGVPSCSFHYNTSYKDKEGRIYFGANNGYVIINPKMTHENKFIPPVVLTQFKIFNQVINSRDKSSVLKSNISETKEIILDHHQNSISFEFAALNFNCSKNNQFAYYLEGFDNSWFYVGTQRTATYTNLNPGKYVFRVKACNNDNVWNEKGISVMIIINPPFWKTWWFIALMIVTILCIIYLIILWRTRIIQNENSQLDVMVKKRTSQLKEANDQLETFVYKASHDIKGPLKSIIGLTSTGKKDVLTGGNPLPYFDHILKSTTKLDLLLQDLLTITKIKQSPVKLEKINFKELVNEVLLNFQNFPGYEKMEFYLDIKETLPLMSDRSLLFSIIQNLVENAIKYMDESKPDNILKMEFVISAKGTDIIFNDNGIGIPADFVKNIFDMFFKANESSNGTGLGLYIVKTSVDKLNGTIHVESKLGEGTTFYIKI